MVNKYRIYIIKSIDYGKYLEMIVFFTHFFCGDDKAKRERLREKEKQRERGREGAEE